MENLVRQLIDAGYLKTQTIIDAFAAVHRKDFLPEREQQFADRNEPLPIGFGQTNSQPLTVAIMLELLQPKKGDRVLDIGAGSGWTTALLASIVGPTGRVVALERIPQLFHFAKTHIAPFDFHHVTLLHGSGAAGYARRAPYDCIHVAAAAFHGVPVALKRQLAMGGRLVIPVGEPMQDLLCMTREENDAFSEIRIPGFSFVPLIEERPT